MLSPQSRLISFVIILPFFLLTLGCKSGKEARKTLPDMGLTEETAVFPGLPFYAVDTTVNGQKFTAVYLRNAAFDSLAFEMVKAWQPFAPSLIKMITDRNAKGVLIDFRSDPSSSASQAVYAGSPFSGTALSQAQTVKIYFVWDEYSAERASGFMDEFRQSASLAINELSTDITPDKRDCFSSAVPDFNHQ